MPLDSPEEDQPDIVVVMPTSRTDAAAEAAGAVGTEPPLAVLGASAAPQAVTLSGAANPADDKAAREEDIKDPEAARQSTSGAPRTDEAVTTSSRQPEDADVAETHVGMTVAVPDGPSAIAEVGVTESQQVGEVAVVTAAPPQVVEQEATVAIVPQFAEEVAVSAGSLVSENVSVSAPPLAEEAVVVTTTPQVGEEVVVTTISPAEDIGVTAEPQVGEESALTTMSQTSEDVVVTSIPDAVKEVGVTTITQASEDIPSATGVASGEASPATNTPQQTSEDLSTNIILHAGEDASVTSDQKSDDSSDVVTALPGDRVQVTVAPLVQESTATAATQPGEEMAAATTIRSGLELTANTVPNSVAEDNVTLRLGEASSASPIVAEAAAVTTAMPDMEETAFTTTYGEVTQAEVTGVDAADKAVPEVAVVPGTEPPQVEMSGAALDAVTGMVVESVTSTLPAVVTALPETVIVTEVVEGIDEVPVTNAVPAATDVINVSTEASVTQEVPVVSEFSAQSTNQSFKTPDDVQTTDVPQEATTEIPEALTTTEAIIEVAVDKVAGQHVADLVSTAGAPEVLVTSSVAPMIEKQDSAVDEAVVPETKPQPVEVENKVVPVDVTTPSPSGLISSESSTASSTSVTETTSGVTRGGVAKPINEAAGQPEAHVSEDVEARPVVAKAGSKVPEAEPSPPSEGRSLTSGDGVVSNPDCPKDVMEADARFFVIVVLLAALSILGVSVVILVMKFRVKPAARRSITMSMCWCLRRARRATITPPFAHHHQHASEVERGKGKQEDYNLASDEDCRADEEVTARAAQQARETSRDMPTWTFCEKSAAAAGPQSPAKEDEVVSSKM
ncbi:calphotin [Frankliniella occidentalis]|uniref:Calphotin n=1 Tax=Frankliniella occidentalis TaxID=133901 RepID=A0A9C6XSM5_FRAOC|nr:calphotin [Frankliniella occidentalis]